MGRSESTNTVSGSIPCSINMLRNCSPLESLPTTPAICTFAPIALSMVATLLAPPRRSSLRSALSRITGASWLMRSASPQTYRSSIRSPSTRIFGCPSLCTRSTRSVPCCIKTSGVTSLGFISFDMTSPKN